MIQKTFILGGEPKFATKFIERLNKRLGSDLQLQVLAHKSWDQYGDKREEIPSGTDLVLVLKSNINHSLRNWARKKATERSCSSLTQSFKFIECCHKVAVAEFDIRHCYQLDYFNQAPEISEEISEEIDLYEKWSDMVGDHLCVLPLWGSDDEGLFLGADAYERMPWVKEGRKKMIIKWDKLLINFMKTVDSGIRETLDHIVYMTGKKEAIKPFHALFEGKSPYYKLINLLKSFKVGSVGHTQVKVWADQWVKDAYLGTNFKDFSGKQNIEWALNSIFGLKLEDLSSEIKEVIDGHYKSKRKTRKVSEPVVESRPEILTQEAWDDYVASNPVVEVEVEPVVEVNPVVEEPYIMLGDLKITPNDTTIKIAEVQLSMGKVKVYGGVSLTVERITNNTLYGVEIKKG